MSDASQTLNRAATTALVVGSMLGAGIFLAPPLVAQATQGPLAFFAIWLVGGLCALAGALCYAELTAMFHRSGGEYSFLQAAYGSPLAFAVGWVQVLAIFPGSIASIALALSSFPLPVALGLPVGTTFEASISIGIAAAICLAVALINALGLRIAGRLQAIVTYLPLLILSIACGWVLWFARAAIPAGVDNRARRHRQG